MNYKNGIPTDVRVAKDASVRKYVTEGRYNAIFMTYDELQKVWSRKQKTITKQMTSEKNIR